MTTTHAGRGLTRRIADAVPVDLLLVVVAALAVDAVVLAEAGWAPIRFVLGAVFLFFLPGYALLAALYPERPRPTDDGRSVVPQLVEPHDGLVFGERLALSFGTSVALIPVVAVGLGAVGLALSTETILGSLTVLVVAFAAIGALRRARVAPDRRYAPFGRSPARGDGGAPRRAGYRGSKVLAAALVLAIVLAGGAFAYGIAAEPPSSPYTSATLLTESDSGEFVASGYPANASVGEPVELTLRVDNERPEPANVTAVAVLERTADGGEAVRERDRLTTLENRLPADGQWNATHEVTPTFAGEDLQVVYYVYHGDVPETVDSETADRELYLRLDVTE